MTLMLWGLTGGIRAACALLLLSRLRPSNRAGRGGVLIGAVGAMILAALAHAAGLAAQFRAALEAAWIAVCEWKTRGTAIRLSLLAGIVYEIAVFLWRFLAMAGAALLFRSQACLDAASPCGQLAGWLTHLLLMVLTAALCWRWRRAGYEIAGREAYRLASAAALAGFFLVITLSEQTLYAIAEDELALWTILAMVLLMALLVFNMNRQVGAERELARLRAEQAELMEREYTALSRTYEANAKLFHDVHHHIGALRRLLEGEKTGEAIRYLDALQEPVRELTANVWTGDEAADYLIGSKAAAAAREGIAMDVQAEFPHRSNIRSADLCAILGNLLDNALEAARQATDPGRRWVRLSIRRIHQTLVIRVENGCAAEPQWENGQPRTTKGPGGLHGWGLKSARSAAERYDGVLQTACEDGVFRAVATLSFCGVQTQ